MVIVHSVRMEFRGHGLIKRIFHIMIILWSRREGGMCYNTIVSLRIVVLIIIIWFEDIEEAFTIIRVLHVAIILTIIHSGKGSIDAIRTVFVQKFHTIIISTDIAITSFYIFLARHSRWIHRHATFGLLLLLLLEFLI